MRKWQTLLWVAVLAVCSVSCSKKDETAAPQAYDPNAVNPANSYYDTNQPSSFYYNPSTNYSSSFYYPVVYGRDVANPSEFVYLGSLLRYSDDPSDSICNPYMASSTYSIFNSYGVYGSSSSPYSAYNASSTLPPAVFYWDGTNLTFAGHLSRNAANPRSVDPDQVRTSVCASY